MKYLTDDPFNLGYSSDVNTGLTITIYIVIIAFIIGLAIFIYKMVKKSKGGFGNYYSSTPNYSSPF